MNTKEYEQKKQECWAAFKQQSECEGGCLMADAFFHAFDCAYALGKQAETITQEEIEKAAKKYAAEVDKNVRDLYGIEEQPASLTFGECAAESFREGAKFTLGKQERESKSMQLSDVKQKIDVWMNSHTDEEVYEALKKYGAIEDSEDTVIKGWVARDKEGYLVLHYKEPHRTLGNTKWYSAQSQKSLPRDSFPDLTWDDDPIEVELIIKRKKK